jgi:hypothetical protein
MSNNNDNRKGTFTFNRNPIHHDDTSGGYPEGDVFDDSEFVAGARTITVQDAPSSERWIPPPPYTAVMSAERIDLPFGTDEESDSEPPFEDGAMVISDIASDQKKNK